MNNNLKDQFEKQPCDVPNRRGKLLVFKDDDRLYLDNRVLMSGDLVELELDKENWFIGQVEIIKSKYEITLFGSDWGRYVPQKKREHTPARWIASRPRFLPPFGEPFTKDNASPDFDDDYDDCLNNIDVDTLIFR